VLLKPLLRYSHQAV